MPHTPLIAIHEGGDVIAEDIELALNDVLARSTGPVGYSRLEGKGALELGESESGALHIKKITIRTEDGLREAFFDQWIPLPAPPLVGQQPVAVAVRWFMRPIRDGAVVECATPELVRVAPGDIARERGVVTIGLLGPRGFQPVPASSDCLDSNQSLLAWAVRLRLALKEIDSLLNAIAVRLSSDGAPVLLWSILLQPVMSTLSVATSTLSDKDHPKNAIRRTSEFLAATEALPARAKQLGDAQIVSLIEKATVGKTGTLAEHPTLHEQCAEVELRVQDQHGRLAVLSQMAGVALSSLPEWLYHGGRFYHRIGQASLQPFNSNEQTIHYRVEPAQISPKAALALLWNLSACEIRFGDVRFEPPATGIDRRRGKELYLQALRGMGYHWIEGQPLAGASLRTTSSSRIVDSALYEPVV